MAIIETDELTKYYGRVVGVRGLSLQVEEGEVFGFLGPNGAGKTTTIRLLLGFLFPSAGRATIFGLDTHRKQREIKERVGYLPEGLSLYERMTGNEFLDYLGGLQRRPSVLRAALTEQLRLSQADLRRQIKGYSRGMRQKLGIIQALQHDPSLVILDEPTEGLDPLMQQEVFAILSDFRERGRTVFMSSHILAEVEKICDRVAIIREGMLVALQKLEELQRGKVRQMEVTFVRQPDAATLKVPGVIHIEGEDRRLRLTIQGDINPVIRALASCEIEELVFERAHLEGIFMGYYRERSDAGER